MSKATFSSASAMVALARARSGVYELLSAFYLKPPSAEVVRGLLAVTGDMVAWSEGKAAVCLQRYAQTYRGDIAALRQEYHDLFTVPLGRYVTPYEAVYRDERTIGDTRVGGLLMGPSTLATLQFYRESGVDVATAAGELPDHIGIELRFMALLCTRERDAWRDGDEAAAKRTRRRQAGFLDRHLLRWVPALARRISQNASSDLYIGIALLTEEFSRWDAAMLNESDTVPAPNSATQSDNERPTREMR